MFTNVIAVNINGNCIIHYERIPLLDGYVEIRCGNSVSPINVGRIFAHWMNMTCDEADARMTPYLTIIWDPIVVRDGT